MVNISRSSRAVRVRPFPPRHALGRKFVMLFLSAFSSVVTKKLRSYVRRVPRGKAPLSVESHGKQHQELSSSSMYCTFSLFPFSASDMQQVVRAVTAVCPKSITGTDWNSWETSKALKAPRTSANDATKLAILRTLHLRPYHCPWETL